MQGLVHAQGELLAQVRPNVITPVPALSADQLRIEITLILAVIDPAAGPANLNVAVYHDDTGGSTFDQTTIIMSETRLQLLQDNRLFQAQHPGSGIHMRPGGQIAVATSEADDVTFSIYGIPETLADRVRGLE